MRKKPDPETDERRSIRDEMRARERTEQASAEERAIDAAVKNSIKLHGA